MVNDSSSVEILVTDAQESGTVQRYATIELATEMVTGLCLWDGLTQWSPGDGFIAVQSDVAQVGWAFVDGAFVAPVLPPPPPLTAEEILQRNTFQRDYFLDVATRAINPLQDAVDLEDATTAEVALLKKLKQYRSAVNRIDLTLKAPSWPDQPK